MGKIFNVKSVIFDRDGVIINSECAVRVSVKKALSMHGVNVTEDDLEYIVGKSVNTYKDYFMSKWKFDFEIYRQAQKQLFLRELESASLFEETIKLINNLYARGIPLGLTTSAGKETTLAVLEKAGISDKFDVIVTKDDCVKLKPDPQPYLMTIEKLEMDPKQCLVVEDTALGVEAAKKAGAFCVAIPNEFSKNHDFSMADAVVNSATEIWDMLGFE